MRKSDLVAAVVGGIECGRNDGAIPFAYLCGWLEKAYEKGDADAVEIMNAMAAENDYVRKYLARGCK